MKKWMTPFLVSGFCVLTVVPACVCGSAAIRRSADERRILTDNFLQYGDWPKGTDWTTRPPSQERPGMPSVKTKP